MATQRAAVSQPRAASRVAASWRRSEDYGVSADAVEPHFTGDLDTDSLLYECGTQVLRGLQATMPNEPVSLMVADRDGLVLARLCNDNAILKSLDRVHLAPGFSYSERTAGTNGLGLSLADRTPTLVRAEDHYCAALRGYTCAAAPVTDTAGELVGTINLTTWSRSSSELLLALAQSAAGNTSALMQVRAVGAVRPTTTVRGQVYQVWSHVPLGDVDACVSRPWRSAVDHAQRATTAGHVVAVVGNEGVGKNTALSLARPPAGRERVMIARVPDPDEIGGWLALWTPEIGSPDTCIIVSGVDALPAWAADHLAERFAAVRHADGVQPFAFTAADFDAVPDRLAALIDTVVEVATLQRREPDVMALAEHVARQERRRPVPFTPAAARALTNYSWPGNAKQLRQVVRAAAARADVVDAEHLDPAVFAADGPVLTRLEQMERDELIRCLAAPDATIDRVAAELGMSRATVYRRIARHGINRPGTRPR